MLIKNANKIVLKLGSATVIDGKGIFKKKWVTSLIKDIKKYGKRKNFVVTPSLACGYYKDGNEIKAGNPLEFYIGIDMFYRFKNNARIGVGIFHISNADSGKKNPGSETLVLKYQIPMGR